ncbi:MAG: hypothetical protein ACK5XN_10830 [Bacteroidota bacterium]
MILSYQNYDAFGKTFKLMDIGSLFFHKLIFKFENFFVNKNFSNPLTQLKGKIEDSLITKEIELENQFERKKFEKLPERNQRENNDYY